MAPSIDQQPAPRQRGLRRWAVRRRARPPISPTEPRWSVWVLWVAVAFSAGFLIWGFIQALLWLWRPVLPFFPLWDPLLAGGAAVIVFGAGWLWWGMPKQQVDRLRIADAKTRSDVEDNFRKTAGQLIGGAAVLIGAGIAYLQLTQQQQAAHDVLISNQVAKGFELLGNKEKSTTLRLGGIYALEGVMNGSEQYHDQVLEALCAFVRDETRTLTGDDAPVTEIQAALTVIGRRKPRVSDFVDLSHAHLPNAVFYVHVEGGPSVFNMGIKGAYLVLADLENVYLHLADLSNADLSGTYLTNAVLSGAYLTNAVLRGTHLNGTDLSGAKGLTQGQLDGACGDDETKLDSPLKIKNCLGY